ncbi:MAG TPA: tetratricopeptide repeat protein [Terracidiphilus sp.]
MGTLFVNCDALTGEGRQGCSGDSLLGRLSEVGLGYQRRLAQNPGDTEALIGMSLVALASRQTEAGIQMAAAAVRSAPEANVAWVALGQALKAAERFSEAEAAYQKAISLKGVNPLARMGVGELLIASGRPADAICAFDLALQSDPTLVAAHLGKGYALGLLSRFADALSHYERALELCPRLAEAEFAAGFALTRLGRPKEAETRYRRALTLRPDFADAWMNLGSLLREQGQDFYAEAALRRATQLRPDMTAAWINLGLLERERRHPDRAEACLRRAFELNPEQVETQVAWCQFRAAERDMAGAWAWLRWALARNPENDEAANMHGILLHARGFFDEAVAAFERAEALGSLPAASNRGNALLDAGRHSDALKAHEAAVARDPLNPGTRYNLALTQLRLGHWRNGWQAYEARWNFREVHRRPREFDKPRWQGEQLNRRRVLLHAEQGLGDTIQFCRFATQVAARGGIPVLQVQSPLARLLRSLPIVHAGQAEIALLGDPLPSFDVECPLMSLPAVFGTTIETVPWRGAYLGAERALVEEKCAQIPMLRGRDADLRIGISWAGNPRYKADQHRSTKLETLLPLLRTAGIEWISLQRGEAAAQLSSLPVDIHVWDGASSDRDLADAAALIASLDLVITTDTCIAHLAGAMGKPVWILLPCLADWRWMEGTDTTPWYPTARLMRQGLPGGWAGVLERVIDDLRWFRPSRLYGTKARPRQTEARPARAA